MIGSNSNYIGTHFIPGDFFVNNGNTLCELSSIAYYKNEHYAVLINNDLIAVLMDNKEDAAVEIDNKTAYFHETSMQSEYMMDEVCMYVYTAQHKNKQNSAYFKEKKEEYWDEIREEIITMNEDKRVDGVAKYFKRKYCCAEIKKLKKTKTDSVGVFRGVIFDGIFLPRVEDEMSKYILKYTIITTFVHNSIFLDK